MANLNPIMLGRGTEPSEIREIFEFGRARAAIVGEENVYDFSLGNPSVPAPQIVSDTIAKLLTEKSPMGLYGYTSAQGDMDARSALAENINKRFQTDYKASDFYLTVGAAAALCCTLSAMSCPGDEFITFAPFFPEYTVFVENTGAKLLVVPAEIEAFQIDFEAFEKMLSPNTKAVIVNSPNNPSGAIYSPETITKLGDMLRKKSKEYGHTIYLISDEPYREILFTEEELPWMPNYYEHTVICYSFSKSLSLPGARIGYVLVSPSADDAQNLYAAICGAGRCFGYVCAPSLFQHVVGKCCDITADIAIYKENRDILVKNLREMGYTVVEPQGAFYLFPRALEADARAFCQRARKYDLLLVPSDSFGCTGHVRLSYCVPTERIYGALEKFKLLAEEYQSL